MSFSMYFATPLPPVSVPSTVIPLNAVVFVNPAASVNALFSGFVVSASTSAVDASLTLPTASIRYKYTVFTTPSVNVLVSV
jgi:hypothetical protein